MTDTMNRHDSIKKHLKNAGDKPPTQLRFAKEGIVTPEIEYAAKKEGLDPEFARVEIAAGEYAGFALYRGDTLLRLALRESDSEIVEPQPRRNVTRMHALPATGQIVKDTPFST